MKKNAARMGVAAVALTAAMLPASIAPAAMSDEADPSATTPDTATTVDALANHEIPTSLPTGATLDMFDYWLDAQDNYAASHFDSKWWNEGISKGHAFKFLSRTDGGMLNKMNKYTGGKAARAGIVQNRLGEDDYPVLSDTYGATPESLAYLFDHTDADDNPGDSRAYKKSYENVGGLFQQDADGYYVFDSTQNGSSYDAATNSVKVFDAPSVGYDNWNNKSIGGMFFPFDGASEQYETDGDGFVVKDGKLVSRRNYVYDGVSGVPFSGLNHYFGMHLTAPFTVKADEPMTYDFKGDDDVWLYVDDVLVGDLGGIHDTADMSIDFQTGVVKTPGVTTTIKAMFEKAGIDTTTGFSGDTFADGTEHTFHMFYLERGNAQSNLKVRFKLPFVEREATLTYDANAVDATGDTPGATTLVGCDVDISESKFARRSFSFLSWNTQPDGSGMEYDPSDNITLYRNRTLYAQWEKAEQVSLSYDANGGSGTMTGETVNKGSDVTVSPNGFSRDGWDFTGWNTKPDGTGDTIDPDSNLTLDHDTVLYAQWTEKKATDPETPGEKPETKPDTPETGLPSTGVEASVVTLSGMLAGVVAGVLLLIRRRRLSRD